MRDERGRYLASQKLRKRTKTQIQVDRDAEEKLQLTEGVSKKLKYCIRNVFFYQSKVKIEEHSNMKQDNRVFDLEIEREREMQSRSQIKKD